MAKRGWIRTGGLLLLTIGLLFAGCRKETRKENAGMTENLTQLPLPDVPAEITEPSERAEYMIMHYWEPMDFRDTLRAYDEGFMAQSFVNFVSLFEFADTTVRQQGARMLLKQAQADTVAYEKLTELIDRYLYDLDSPMLSEENYIPFLQAMVADPFPGETAGENAAITLSEVMKNRPGSVAADFVYERSDGKKASLHSTAAPGELMLIFYDPDCDRCQAYFDKITNDEVVTQHIKNQELTVLAIYSGPNREEWKSKRDELPQDWIVGYEPGEIDRQELYVIRATPTIYLLSGPDKKVLIKDMFYNTK